MNDFQNPEDFFDQLLAAAKQTRLASNRQAQIRQQIVLAMDQAPAAKQSRLSSLVRHWLILRPVQIGFAMLVLIGLVGATSAAASTSLPGDVLYSMKLNFNEPLQSFLAVSTAAKVNVEIKNAAQRLKEADTLASQGKLDDQKKFALQANFAMHTEQARRNLQKLQNKQQGSTVDHLVTSFEKTLQSNDQGVVALELHEQKSDGQGNSVSINTSIRTAKTKQSGGSISNIKSNSNINSNNQQSNLVIKNDAGTVAAARIKLAKQILGSITSSDNSAAQLAVAEDFLKQAEAALAVNDFQKAIDLANQSFRAALNVQTTTQIKTDSRNGSAHSEIHQVINTTHSYEDTKTVTNSSP